MSLLAGPSSLYLVGGQPTTCEEECCETSQLPPPRRATDCCTGVPTGLGVRGLQAGVVFTYASKCYRAGAEVDPSSLTTIVNAGQVTVVGNSCANCPGVGFALSTCCGRRLPGNCPAFYRPSSIDLDVFGVRGACFLQHALGNYRIYKMVGNFDFSRRLLFRGESSSTCSYDTPQSDVLLASPIPVQRQQFSSHPCSGVGGITNTNINALFMGVSLYKSPRRFLIDCQITISDPIQLPAGLLFFGGYNEPSEWNCTNDTVANSLLEWDGVFPVGIPSNRGEVFTGGFARITLNYD